MLFLSCHLALLANGFHVSWKLKDVYGKISLSWCVYVVEMFVCVR